MTLSSDMNPSRKIFPFLNPCPSAQLADWDKILFRSKNFVVVPTIGAIVKGWLLIVPKHSYLCLGAMDENLLCELIEFKREIVSRVEKSFGRVVAFEHGPASKSQKIGCGVDHAHLHVVPWTGDLVSAVHGVFKQSLQWSSANGLFSTVDWHSRGLPYLYIENSDGSDKIASHASFPSQLVRQAIAARAGIPEQYDWAVYPMETNVRETIETLNGSGYRSHSHDKVQQ